MGMCSIYAIRSATGEPCALRPSCTATFLLQGHVRDHSNFRMPSNKMAFLGYQCRDRTRLVDHHLRPVVEGSLRYGCANVSRESDYFIVNQPVTTAVGPSRFRGYCAHFIKCVSLKYRVVSNRVMHAVCNCLFCLTFFLKCRENILRLLLIRLRIYRLYRVSPLRRAVLSIV